MGYFNGQLLYRGYRAPSSELLINTTFPPKQWREEGNLVPRAFPLKGRGAGKDPGIGWSRVHLTP